MTDTRIESWLAERRSIHAAATEGPWEADGTEISQHWSRPEPWAVVASNEIACMAFCYGGSARGIEHEEDANAAVDAFNTLPALVAMVEAVLGQHRPVEVEPSDTICSDTICGGCSNRLPNGRYVLIVGFPCPTVRALEAARKAVSGDE